MNRDKSPKKLNKCWSRNLRGLTGIEKQLKNIPAATQNDGNDDDDDDDDDDGAHATRILLRKSLFNESLFFGNNTNIKLFTNSEEDLIKSKSLMALIEKKIFISNYRVTGKGSIF